jgi:hypothetical protein
MEAIAADRMFTYDADGKMDFQSFCCCRFIAMVSLSLDMVTVQLQKR